MNFRIFRIEILSSELFAPTFVVVPASVPHDEIEAHICAAARYVPGMRVEPVGGYYPESIDANRKAMRLAEENGRIFAPFCKPVVEKIEF